MGRGGIVWGLLLLIAAGIATWAVLREDTRGAPETRTIEHVADVPAAPPARVTLKGRAPDEASPPSGEATPEADPPGPRAVAPPQAIAGLERARLDQLNLKRWTEDGPRTPRRPDRPDLDLGDPGRRMRLSRYDLIDERAITFEGVVEVMTDDALRGEEPEADEIEDPLVTAVVGRVVAEGQPLAGARVILYSSFYLRHARYDHRVREVGRTTTNAEGIFDLRPIGLDTVHFGADGEVLVTIHRQGYASLVARRLDNIRPEQENDLGVFSLSTASVTLTGTIRNRKGEPVVGAAVRVSGSMNPVIYDKTDRLVVLKDCPTALTDEEGTYRLEGFAPGQQVVSIHVNIDCVRRQTASYAAGEHTWSPTVLAGGSVTGRIVDGHGDAVADAVVSGGSNWTPSNEDGTFWLDNIEDGPFVLEVFHHGFRHVSVPGVVADTEDLEIVMTEPLPRIRLRVTDESTGAAIDIVSIDWRWTGAGRSRFVPVSPFWHAKDGVIEVVVPENASGAWVTAGGYGRVELEAEQLVDGLAHDLVLKP